MSLDVYLRNAIALQQAATRQAIFIREDGQTKELSREVWNQRYTARTPVTVEVEPDDPVFHANITHNLGGMAREAGIYPCLWHPEEIGITRGRQLIEPLVQGLATLMESPETYRAMNPPNGWGTYEGLCDFVARYLCACEMYPNAEVSVSR